MYIANQVLQSRFTFWLGSWRDGAWQHQVVHSCYAVACQRSSRNERTRAAPHSPRQKFAFNAVDALLSMLVVASKTSLSSATFWRCTCELCALFTTCCSYFRCQWVVFRAGFYYILACLACSYKQAQARHAVLLGCQTRCRVCLRGLSNKSRSTDFIVLHG